MNKHIAYFLALFSILFLFSCVSKKKYLELQTTSASKSKEYDTKFQQLNKRSDSLLLALNQKDSLIDSLTIRLAETQKKEKVKPVVYSKTSSTLTKEQEYDKKALFIYNFTKYIEWPVEYNGTEFVIGVCGDDNVVNGLKMFMSEKKTFGKKIIVKQYVKGAEYNMVFITAAKSNTFFKIKNDVKRKKTVLISDDESLNPQGVHISFIIDQDKIRYIVNKLSIEKLGLKVAQELMRYSG